MIESCNGWILDAYIEYGQSVLWIKTVEGNALKVVGNYDPSFFLLPKTDVAGSELVQVLSDMELVKVVKWADKFTDINDSTKSRLVYVQCYSIQHYNLLLKALQHNTMRQRIRQTYNTKLSHLHQYIYENIKNPLAKVLIEHDNGDLISISESNDPENLDVPFSIMYVNINPKYSQSILDGDDQIESISARIAGEIIEFNGNEADLLQQFSAYTFKKDPDIIVFNYESITALNYLLQRIKSLSLNLPMGRRKVDIYSNESRIVCSWSQGRIYLYDKQFGINGIEGLLELSRFSCLPIGIISGQSIGRLIAARNMRELTTLDHVISDSNNRTCYEQIRTIEEIVKHDKAGMIFSPKVGLHENVAVLDYNDEFANIIINENISYESNHNTLGLLPQIVKGLVDRRIYFRQKLKKLSVDSLEALQYQRRAETCKQILVSLYGTTGSFWNKYGNVLAFEEINRKSREILLKTKDIIQDLGFELIYSDTDACFVHKNGATKNDYKKLGDKISKETGLAISLEYHYKFLVLLPLEADEKLEALKHYFGITFDGELVMRGIETRRHDSPEFVKQFQKELLHILFDCEKVDDIYDITLEKALYHLTTTIDQVMTGEINAKDLVISKQLRMDITKYKNLFPHVAAAIQSINTNGRLPVRGEIIQFVYTDSQHLNPLNRVIIPDDSLNSIEYDREKYKEILIDAAETILGIFGFDPTMYGKAKDRKWWTELRRNRIRDVDVEAGSKR
jgi:DNA polymerase elongation subunit (family B)